MMVLRKAETLVYQGTEPPTLKLLAEAILSVRARAPLGQDQTITAHVSPEDWGWFLEDQLARESLLVQPSENAVYFLGARLHATSEMQPGKYEVRADFTTQEEPLCSVH
jgi:hypothetical protein